MIKRLRVYELAKLAGVESKVVMEYLNSIAGMKLTTAANLVPEIAGLTAVDCIKAKRVNNV